jgi:TRAP-type transport system periplasmic protein
MPEPIRIRMGGYGPPTTGFSRALKRIGDRLLTEFGDRIEVKYIWNIMDLGYRAEDILWLVEDGLLTLGYQSSSYLTDRVPELGIVDLPFLFADTRSARAAMDGALGDVLAGKIEERVNFRVLGWFENGFRHISNRIREVRTPRPAEQGAGTHLRIAGRGAHAHGSNAGDRDDRRRHHRRAGESAVEHSDLRRAQVPSLPHPEQPLLHLAADLPAPPGLRCLAR